MKRRSSGGRRSRIRRIDHGAASRIVAQLEHLLEAPLFLEELTRSGFGHFLSQLDEETLRLAIQPDVWGERTRAQLVSAILAGFSQVPVELASAEEIADATNTIVPCFLLELGKRSRRIEAEFPHNPLSRDVRFLLATGPGCVKHTVTRDRLAEVTRDAGSDLVGLCCFGDDVSRKRIEAKLSNGKSTNAKALHPMPPHKPPTE